MTGTRRRVAVVTGSRADFGLLRPVMRVVARHSALDQEVIVTGTHLLPPALTVDEVAAEFDVAERLTMQVPEEPGRTGDARALGRGVSGFATRFAEHPPDFVLVLGDRIEAFAAAGAAAVAGIRVAHVHGGDRAEGIADESLRHAISKLAHVHLAASASSAERLICMGEEPARVHLVGSPAIDGLDSVPPLPNEIYETLGRPSIVLLLHPSGDEDEDEWANAERAIRLCCAAGPTLALEPNHDPGREGILEAIEQSSCRRVAHLPREQFVGLLLRTGLLVGNSSAGLIECAALGVRAVNLGSRQRGREMPANVTDIPDWDFGALDMALERRDVPLAAVRHPYGDGTAGEKIADVLAWCDLERHGLRKCNTY